jgi:hypothetical protein
MVSDVCGLRRYAALFILLRIELLLHSLGVWGRKEVQRPVI